jgi:WD40 repeat protein/serine/threonine protein kinase
VESKELGVVSRAPGIDTTSVSWLEGMIARAHDHLVGRSLGEFVLRERIGEGGFGAVYRAVQTTLDREAVVKVLHGRLHASQGAIERFLREARLASKLDHPYAAHIYAFGAEPDGELWIAMELVRGTPLDRILKSQGPLPLERFVPLLDRICEVVHTAHEQGIVHRDLKPANVMVLARAGRLLPKLLDFGIAKGLADGPPADTIEEAPPTLVDPSVSLELSETQSTLQSGGLTQRGAIIGSPHYMAPEQWLDAGHVDARSDLYALGSLAYECLTGRPPFVGDSIGEIAIAHADLPVPPLGARFPAALDGVLGRVLAKQPDARFADALAFASAFRHAAGIATEQVSLPAIDSRQRDATISSAPQPIAEAFAAVDAARNAHQARDAIVQAARALARYLGLLAVACRSRVLGGHEPAAVTELMRSLTRRALTEIEWLELATGLTGAWVDRRDAYPVPELVEAFHDRHVAGLLEPLCSLRDHDTMSDALHERLEAAFVQASKVLEALAFLRDYALVVTTSDGVAERWMGVRRPQRTTMAVRGKGLPSGVPALLDSDGVPVLSLAPLIQIAPPTPGAPLELFLFDGRGTRGAKLVALPAGFEHHDDTLWDWFRAQLAGTLDDTEAAVAEEKPPYRGLSAFSADDGAQFVGREKLVDAFSNRLKLQPLLAVVGRSGAGKSSFVQAGVIPSLPRGWRAITMRPGPSPLGALIARLEHAGFPPITHAALASNRDALGDLLRGDAARRGPVLLVIDQLEEMFTLCQDDGERRAFAGVIAAAARSAEDPVRVIFTLRDDFLVRTEQVPALRNRIGQGLQLLTVPMAEDLLRILVEPARRGGYEFEDRDLPLEMVKEVADQPGALALISFTAQKLWELRDRHFKQLTRAAYRTLGGVGGALARHADVTLDSMPPEERSLVREAFRHLVTTQNTRAVLTRKDLKQLLGSGVPADRVIEELVAARLVVAAEDESGRETIEIVHEALLVAWPRLVEWRREDADGARFREQLRTTARQWDERGRAKGLLWRGDALGEYTRWRARHAGPLTDTEAAFAEASIADAARGRRNRRLLVAIAFVALGAGTIVFAEQSAQNKAQARELHDHLRDQYEDQGRRYVLADDPLRALAYLGKAAELGATGRSHDFLVAQAVQATDGELLEVRHGGPVRDASFSATGDRFITASEDHSARIWDARTGALLVTMPHAGTVLHASIAPDGRTALTANAGGVVLWDAQTGTSLRQLQEPDIHCAVYSRDGTLVLATSGDHVVTWSVADGTVRFRGQGDGANMLACAFSSDGHTIATGDEAGTTRIFDLATGRTLHVLRDQHAFISAVAFSQDGQRLAAASADNTAMVWAVSTGRALATLAHRDAVRSVSFAPDGERVVTGSVDRTATLWDAATGKRLVNLTGHTAAVTQVRFSPDGAHVVTGSDDASAILWDAASGQEIARWRGHQGRLWGLAIDPTGTRVVTAGDDGVAVMWRATPQADVIWLPGQTSAHFDADGRRIVAAGPDHAAHVFDANTGVELAALHTTEPIAMALFNRDGRRVAGLGQDGNLHVWDFASRSELWSKPIPSAWTMAWSPDDRTIAVGTRSGELQLWEVDTQRRRFAIRAHGGGGLLSVAFDPGGTRMITTGGDKVTRVWSLAGEDVGHFPDADGPNTAVYDPQGGRVLGVYLKQKAKIWDALTGLPRVELLDNVGLTDGSWSPDGSMVIVVALDSTARIWDATTGALLATFPLAGPDTASFSPDSTRIALAGAAGTAIHALPRTHPDAAQLQRILRCRVPFEVEGDRLRPRPREWSGCEPGADQSHSVK